MYKESIGSKVARWSWATAKFAVGATLGIFLGRSICDKLDS